MNFNFLVSFYVFMFQTKLFQGKEDYLANLQTLLRMMVTQSSGYPTGNHGMFYKYRIEAVTLHGSVDRNIMGRDTRRVDFENIGRYCLEFMVRLSNKYIHRHAFTHEHTHACIYVCKLFRAEH